MITTTELEGEVFVLCDVCGENKTIVYEDDAKFAYTEINKFRGEHEHLEKMKKEN